MEIGRRVRDASRRHVIRTISSLESDSLGGKVSAGRFANRPYNLLLLASASRSLASLLASAFPGALQ